MPSAFCGPLADRHLGKVNATTRAGRALCTLCRVPETGGHIHYVQTLQHLSAGDVQVSRRWAHDHWFVNVTKAQVNVRSWYSLNCGTLWFSSQVWRLSALPGSLLE